MKHNDTKNKIRKNKYRLGKRLCSLVVASALLIANLPILFSDDYFSDQDTVYAANKDSFSPYTNPDDDITPASDGVDDGKYTFGRPEDLVDYSKYYYSFPSNHQNDVLELAFADGISTVSADDFIALGTQSYPFKGKVIVAAGAISKLNLPEALFDYVADSASIVASDAANAAPAYVLISRITNSANEPILARYVVHDTAKDADSTWTGNAWQIQIEPYSNGTDAATNHAYAGIIGEMQSGSKMQISLKDGTTADIKGTSDLGRICGSMGRNSMLTVNSIAGVEENGTTTSNTSYLVSTTQGHAGGVVGSMDDGSVLVMKCLPANTSATISTLASGYAGGIVGKNDGGFVDISAINNYTVEGTITGILGAGSLFGYARPLINDPRTSTNETTLTYDLSKISINANINGTGNVGGLFGELHNKTVSISGTPEIRTDAAGGTIIVSGGTATMTHAGAASNIGGIAGTYKPYSLGETLSISSVTVSVTNNGTYNNYGGGIGRIEEVSDVVDPAYVSFSSFTATATGGNTSGKYFGGLVGKGDEAFVEANGVKITANNFRGGAAVGCMARGVLKLTGTVDFTDAKPCETGVDAIREGKVVGYRDNTLIYYDGASTGLTLDSTRKVDNIGTWGDILILDGTKLSKSNILTENTDHTITMTAPSATITSRATYATQALSMQIAYGENPIITNDTASAATTIVFGTSATGQSAAVTASIDLTGTGIRGLTRDNKRSDTDTRCLFSGTITGNGSTIKLDVENVITNTPVYGHSYNGLIGVADTVTVTNLILDGTMKLEPTVEMYAGMVAAVSNTSLTVTNTAACGTASTSTFTTSYHVSGDNKWGSSALYLGRLVGNVSGNISVSGGSYDGEVFGNATSENSCYGGVVGRIDGATTSTFSGVTVKGSVSNSGANAVQKVGGLIAEIVKGSTESRVNLDSVTLNNLAVNGNASSSSGGLLGYAWYNTNVQGSDTTGNTNVGLNVTVSGTSKVSVTDGASSPTTKNGSTAGLVYCATGRWLVGTVEFSGFSVDMASASSYGMLVNQGKNGTEGLYMVLPDGYTYTIAASAEPFATHSGVYDELVAYSSSGGVTKNGQGIVSIHTSNDSLTMDGTVAGNTYSARTAIGKTKSNSNTRYYYNLDAIATTNASSSDASVKLMNWGLHQYASPNLQKYFDDPFDGTISGTFDMKGYSWYPIDVDDSLVVNGTFTLYNSKIEKNIRAKNDTKYSTLSNTSQHYLMHNALFNDVNAKLTVGTVTLKGNVGKANGASGALVIGTVQGTASSDAGTAEVKVTGGITLDGIHVHNFDPSTTEEYAPLLINQTGDFSKLTIKNVSVASDASYKDNTTVSTLREKNNFTGSGSTTYTATTYPKIATSLIGNAGIDTNSRNVTVSFEGIQLDGRKSGTLSSDSNLTGNYHSVESLFTKATLLNKFQYQSGGGTYEFNKTEDWTGTNHDVVNVTYGSEISDNTERKENFGKEFWYKDGESTDANGFTTGDYILPENRSSTSGNAGAIKNGDVISWTAPYDFSGFLPYVYTKYSGAANDGVVGAHQLKINHYSAGFSGCGTYNDPYIITSGTDLVNIENIINGDFSDITLGSIILPTKTENGKKVFDPDATWHNSASGYGDASFSQSGSGSTMTYNLESACTVDLTQLRTYLAGAYYKIAEGETITISGGQFTGLGDISNESDTFAVFRGVIVGTGTETIINQTGYPLIASSYGSVVSGLTISVDCSSIEKINASASNKFTEGAASNKCPYYGAVMGQIFGGDNIIDNVYVNFNEGTSVIVKGDATGDAAHLIPVGGYIGVVVNGGVYFRNMATNNNISGLPNNQTYKTNTDGEHLITKNVSEVINGATVLKTVPNTKYLYVNPIIGRVINGFAVTETTAYRPYEDGTRTYPDGTVDTWSADHVTMQNSTKNYSIADINKNDTTHNFTMEKDDVTSGDEGATVTVSNAQSLFIISLITESGLGTSCNEKYDDTNNILKPYTDYMATHLSEYKYVGNVSVLPSSEQTTPITNPTTDAQKAAQDYYLSTCDIYVDSSNNSTKVPYLIKTYTPQSANGYPAFNLAAFTADTMGTGAELYLNLTFSDSGDSAYQMPDGFRGLGALLLGQDAWNSNYRLYNTMCLYSLDGNNRIVSLNMNLTLYSDDNYTTPRGVSDTNPTLKTGFGFFNALRCDYNGDTSHKLKNISITGAVKYDLILSSTGSTVNLSSITIDNQPLPAVGGFIGAPGVDTQVSGTGDGGGGDMWIENIQLNNLNVSGFLNTGGFMGCSNAAKTYTFYECSTDNLNVEGGCAVGGIIGYIRNMDSKIKVINEANSTNFYGVISVKARGTIVGNSKSYGATASGALFGDNYASNADGVKVENVVIKNASSVVTGYVGYSSETNKTYPRSGGILGLASRNSGITIKNVTIQNIDIKGVKAGGCIGYCTGNNPVNVTNCSVETDQNCVIENTSGNNDNGGSGGIVGTYDKTADIIISDSCVQNYIVSGYKNCGGLIGRKLQANKIICNNIEVNSASIKTNEKGGGLIGDVSAGSMIGYNILVDATTFEKITGTGASDSWGYVAGQNNNRPIQLVGYSRQGSITTDRIVGTYTTNIYGPSGYVIFADYNGTASTQLNDKFSIIKANDCSNVSPSIAVNSNKVVTNYTIIAKRNTDNSLEIKDVQETAGSPVSDVVKPGIGEGEEHVEYSSGTRLAISKPSNIVTNLDDLTTGTRKDGGFYLCLNAVKAHDIYQAGPWYVSNTGKSETVMNGSTPLQPSSALPVKKTVDSTCIWKFEKDGASYKIYTSTASGKQYITTSSGNNIKPLDTTGDLLTISVGSADNSPSNTFWFKKTGTGSYLQYSNGGKGIRYYGTPGTTDAEINRCFQIMFVDDGDEDLIEYTYSTMSYDGSAFSLGELTSSGSASSQQSTYNEILSAYESKSGETTDGTYEVFSFSKTVWTNNYLPGDNASPFVTTNPKRIVSSDDKFLTGDGIYNSSSDSAYASSAIAQIITDASGGSVMKRYQSYNGDDNTYPLTSNDDSVITMFGLLNTQKKYTSYKNARGTTNLPTQLSNMPVLIIDDISADNTTKLVNSYLRLLTNTSYDFATTNDTVYKVRLATCIYTKSGSDYNLGVTYSTDNSTGVNLKLDTTNNRFKIGGSYDNSNMSSERFTLIDVEFYDPANNSGNIKKTAYHLYVPVFVKKMLHFKFESAAISGTTYRLQPYSDALDQYKRVTIIENLGNPITMQFSWTYEQTFDEWMDLIKAGEKLTRAYDKQLEFTDHTSAGLPTGTKLALVDANRNNPVFYAEKTTAGLITVDSTRAITCLNLDKFVASDNTTAFTPIEFNDFFDVLDSAPTTDVDSYSITEDCYFIPTTSSDQTATIRTNDGTYYKPGSSTDTGAKQLYIRYKPGMADSNGYLAENYYLSFFTPEPETTDVYHLEFNSPQTFGGTEYPSNASSRIPTHIFTGDIFENSCTIVPYNGTLEMAANTNNWIGAEMTANIGLKTGAGAIIRTFINYQSVSVYQSFLLQLNQSYYTDAEMNNLTSEKGIAEGSNPSVKVESFSIKGIPLNTIHESQPTANTLAQMSDDNALINASFLELRSNVNLKQYLNNAYNDYTSGVASDTKFSIVARVKLTYSEDENIQAQFPENTDATSEKGRNIGTNITGSSNISSQASAAAYSKTSAPGSDSTKYYRKLTKKAILNYYSADTEEVIVTPATGGSPAVKEDQLLAENKYEQFGINAIDPERTTVEDSLLHMKTQADYNILNLTEDAKDKIRSMKITVSLRRKVDYEDTGKLPISPFIADDSLVLYQKEIGDATLTKITASSTSTDYVYYVNCTRSDFVGNIYRVPINFSVYTGQNNSFENKTYNSGADHMYYSNYMVKLNAELYDAEGATGNMIIGSDVEDHIIYTNAKIYYDIVPGD